MKKKILNTVIFFTLLYWLAIYFFVFKKPGLFKQITFLHVAGICCVYIIILILSKKLVPVFQAVLVVAHKIGSLIFGLLTCTVFIFILTPIALLKRLSKSQLLSVKIEKNLPTYYEDWESSVDIKKQY